MKAGIHRKCEIINLIFLMCCDGCTQFEHRLHWTWTTDVKEEDLPTANST